MLSNPLSELTRLSEDYHELQSNDSGAASGQRLKTENEISAELSSLDGEIQLVNDFESGIIRENELPASSCGNVLDYDNDKLNQAYANVRTFMDDARQHPQIPPEAPLQ